MITDLAIDLPLEFELGVYRTANPDLGTLTDADLYRHYLEHGCREGRPTSTVTDRNLFVSHIPSQFRCLEIGPFNVPCLDPRQTDYVDVRDADALRARAVEIGIDPSGVPDIRWVSPDGTLGSVTEQYDLVLSSHAIEHQVDLVHHLREVAAVLRPGGYYFCVIPDSRYCFDHFLAPSTLADVLVAHAEGRRRHSLKSVVEHWALTTHNDAVRHWAGDHGSPSANVEQARRAWDAWHDETALLDVHAWQFTPETFAALVQDLGTMGLIDFNVVRTYPTLRNAIEFFSALRLGNQPVDPSQ